MIIGMNDQEESSEKLSQYEEEKNMAITSRWKTSIFEGTRGRKILENSFNVQGDGRKGEYMK